MPLPACASVWLTALARVQVYNEPGVEAARGSGEASHMERTSSNGGYEPLRVATVRWAMLDALRHPLAGFEEAVRRHFTVKRAFIVKKVLEPWLRDAAPGSAHQQALQKVVRCAPCNPAGPAARSPRMCRRRSLLSCCRSWPSWAPCRTTLTSRCLGCRTRSSTSA